MKSGSARPKGERCKRIMRRPRSGRLPFLVWLLKRGSRCHRRVGRVGKWKNWGWFSTFPGGPRRGGGNVKISPQLRDFQGPVERVGNLLLVFHAFHGPGISTAPYRHYANFGRDRVLYCCSNLVLAAFIRKAHSVSLIACARCSSSGIRTPDFKNCSAPGRDCSFSNGVR
jgi:hypothetical protein